MGWSIGFDSNWKRDVGYGVPAYCDHPECSEVIDRGFTYVCGGDIYGGERGCGLYFCARHMYLPMRRPQMCERCEKRRKPFDAKPDHPDWINLKLTDESWRQWRDENPELVSALKAVLQDAQSGEEKRDA